MYRWISRRVRMARLNLAVFFMPRIAGADDDPPKDPPKKEDPPAKTFTQEDLNRIVQERLDRAKKDAPSDDEITKLRDAAKKLAEIEDQNRSELEKAAARAEKAEKERDEALGKVEALGGTITQMTRKQAVFAAASEIGADAEIVHALLTAADFKVTDGEKNNFEITIGDDGQVIGAAEAVNAIATLKNLVGKNTPPGPGDGGARQPLPPADAKDALREAEAKGDTEKAMSLKTQQLAGLMTK